MSRAHVHTSLVYAQAHGHTHAHAHAHVRPTHMHTCLAQVKSHLMHTRVCLANAYTLTNSKRVRVLVHVKFEHKHYTPTDTPKACVSCHEQEYEHTQMEKERCRVSVRGGPGLCAEPQAVSRSRRTAALPSPESKRTTRSHPGKSHLSAE